MRSASAILGRASWPPMVFSIIATRWLVIFAGADEVVTFSHTAYSKAVFGKGAVQAAKFLAGKPAGMYNMSDVIDAAM